MYGSLALSRLYLCVYFVISSFSYVCISLVFSYLFLYVFVHLVFSFVRYLFMCWYHPSCMYVLAFSYLPMYLVRDGFLYVFSSLGISLVMQFFSYVCMSLVLSLCMGLFRHGLFRVCFLFCFYV